MEMLGEILLRKKILDSQAVEAALQIQKRTGSRLGDILISQGVIGYYKLYDAVAESHRLPFADLLHVPPAPGLLEESKAIYYLTLRVIPWKKQNGRLTVALCDLRDEVVQWAKMQYGDDIGFAITSPLDIRRTVERHFGLSLENYSRLALWRSRPEQSARQTLHGRQKAVLGVLLLGCAAMLALAPSEFTLGFFLLCHAAYFLSMLFKALLLVSEAHSPARPPDWSETLPSLRDDQLPVYSILVPMYKEAASVAHLVKAIQNLDYPPEKLDIKLVLEDDDSETLLAIKSAAIDYRFEIIRVPPAQLRTKPRACNYALRFVKGDYLTIYDADDRPEPLQLKKAVYMFSILPRNVICLQARLNYYNAGQNLLTRLFSIEYGMLFHFLLHGLQRFSIPIPLGGTSNHFIRTRLEELGEWDPYNVTEDADLGTRLTVRGYKTALLDSDTLEEAPISVGAWIRQRSRWIKGYMQTWLVHMRHPFRLYRQVGWRGFLGFQCFIGLSCFVFLTAPLVWLGAAFAANILETHPGALQFLYYGMGINIGLYLLSSWYGAFLCLPRLPLQGRSWGAAALYPLYGVLHSIASYKSLWQLIVKPHFWEKTTHGLAPESQNIIIPLTETTQIGYKAPSFTG